jgi:arginine decarboxylase
MDKFVDLHDVKKVLEIHPFDGTDYYLGIFLVGAYQEVMGSNHNLFGQPNEAHVIADGDGAYHIKRTIPGSTIGNMLDFARYDRDAVRDRFFAMIDARLKTGDLDAKTGARLKDRYDAHLKGITYLV